MVVLPGPSTGAPRLLAIVALAALLVGAAGRVTAAERPPAASATAAVAADGDADGPSLLRSVLLVADLDRSRRFYETLGFAVEAEMGGARDPAASAFPLAADSTRSQLLILASPRAGSGRIGLLAFTAPAPTATRTPRREVGAGDLVFVLDVDDARAVHARLVAAGFEPVGAPRVYRSRRTDAAGRPLEGHVFHVFDPDGHLVELLEPARPVQATP